LFIDSADPSASSARIEAYGTRIETSVAGSGTVKDADNTGGGVILLNSDCTYDSSKFNGTISIGGIPRHQHPARASSMVHGVAGALIGEY
jgi:hypothetical protein